MNVRKNFEGLFLAAAAVGLFASYASAETVAVRAPQIAVASQAAAAVEAPVAAPEPVAPKEEITRIPKAPKQTIPAVSPEPIVAPNPDDHHKLHIREPQAGSADEISIHLR